MDMVCRKAIFALMAVTLVGPAAAQSSYSLLLPNKQIEIKIKTGDRIQYYVLLKGTPLLQKSTLSIDIDHNTLGLQPRVKDAKPRTYDGRLSRQYGRSSPRFARTITNCGLRWKETTRLSSGPITRAQLIGSRLFFRKTM